MSANPRGQVFAILKRANLTRDERLAIYQSIVVRDDITSTNDLSANELQTIAGCLFSWDAAGHLDAMAADILGRRAA